MNYPLPHKITEAVSEKIQPRYFYVPENKVSIRVKKEREPLLLIAVGHRGTGKTMQTSIERKRWLFLQEHYGIVPQNINDLKTITGYHEAIKAAARINHKVTTIEVSKEQFYKKIKKPYR